MEANTSSEDVLWQRALKGDGDAFGLIFDKHRDRVFRHAYRLLPSRHEAEDAAAVAFLELWRKRRSVKPLNGSVLPWLLVTATNASRNLRRSSHRYQRLLQRLPRAGTADSPEERLVSSGLDADLSAAISGLGKRDAQLFCLIALEDYSPTEVAEILGSSPGAVRTRLHRIRQRLQDELGHTSLKSYQMKEAL